MRCVRVRRTLIRDPPVSIIYSHFGHSCARTIIIAASVVRCFWRTGGHLDRLYGIGGGNRRFRESRRRSLKQN
jgi:hypothetical protein